MTDAIKIAVKTALIVGITAGIIAIFANVQVPAFNVQLVANALGKGRAIVNYYAGVFSPLVDIAIYLLILYFITIPAFKIGSIAIKWILKVNE